MKPSRNLFFFLALWIFSACSDVSDGEYVESEIFKVSKVLPESTLQLQQGFKVVLIGINPTSAVESYLNKHVLGKDIMLKLESQDKKKFAMTDPVIYAYCHLLDPKESINATILKQGFSTLNYALLQDSLTSYSIYFRQSTINYSDVKVHKELKPDTTFQSLITTSPKLQEHAHQVITLLNAKKLPPKANQYDQICAIWEHTYSRWHYIYDPLVARDTWRSADKTLDLFHNNGSNFSGDCDDFAIFMTSMCKSVGIPGRYVVAQPLSGTLGHAYSEFFVPKQDLNLAEKSVKNYFGSLIKSLHSRRGTLNGATGLWINLDWWSPHVGGEYYQGAAEIYFESTNFD